MHLKATFQLTALYLTFALAGVNFASAQTLTNFKTSQDRVPVNTPVTALVEFKEADRNWCGFYIDWGDGKEPQSFRIGRKPDLASPVSRQRSFDKPGTYTLKAYGAFVSKGLQSAEKCGGTLQPITITIYDPAVEKEREAQEAVKLERERKKLDEERLALEQKARELELEKERLKDPVYRKQQEEIEKKKLAEERAKKLAAEREEKARLAEESRKQAEAQKAAAKEEKRLEGVRSGKFLSKNDKGIAKVMETSALCAGFYSRWGPGGRSDCASLQHLDVFSKEGLRAKSACDAHLSNLWYVGLMNGEGGASKNLVEYLQANASKYEAHYGEGQAANRGSNMDLTVAGTCRTYVDNMIDSMSKR